MMNKNLHNRINRSDSLYYPFRIHSDTVAAGNSVNYPGFATYTFLYVTQGAGELTTKYETFSFEGPFCILIPKLIPFNLSSNEHFPLDLHIIEYTVNQREQGERNLDQFKIVNIDNNSLKHVVTLLLNEINSPSRHFNAIMEHIFNLVMIFDDINTAQMYEGPEHFYISENIRQAQYFIEHNFHKKISVKDVAAQTKLSSDYFITVFHDELGLTPHQYIIRCRMNHSHFLLENTHKSIQVIAKECGYQSTNHFSTKFKEFFGYSPRNLKTK